MSMYLGVILDCRLNWTAHVKEKARKALTAFWICRNSFGRNWGLPSRAILWIYEAVVRPMLSHGCVVWWPKLNAETIAKEFSEVQRLVCICSTGAMKTTSTAALEALLDLPPIQLVVQAKAYTVADRLQHNGLWTPNFETGHGRIRNLISDPILDMPRDRMIPEICFRKNFNTVIMSRTELLSNVPNTLTDAQHRCFTDGSKTREGAGAGIYAPDWAIQASYNLSNLTDVFQAEAFAVLMAAHNILPPGTTGVRVRIYSDSEALIKALDSPVTTSKIVGECKEYLNRMGPDNRITLVWVPGHAEVEGIERADELAKQGSSTPGIGPEPSIPISKKLCDGIVKDWLRSEHAQRWGNYKGGMHTKNFLPTPIRKWTKELIGLDRDRIRRVVGAITGHCGLNKHLAKMGIKDSPGCSCGSVEETGIHILCECPKFSQLRLRLLGGHTIDPREIIKLGPATLDRFLAGTERL